MAQSNAEMAKDMVVALLGRVTEFQRATLEDHSTQLGKAIAEVYSEILKEINK